MLGTLFPFEFIVGIDFSKVILYYRVFKRNCRVLWGLIVGEQIITASRVV